ncbi:ribosomal protein S18-alanine N-acetyltransferase [Virgibacillus siamensis]|uniref:ribosomal protein S18-alanine N-acetyltransferase n=1 Tax=Virgibacillus siamensis TaxID=480071 RepID=UPI000986B1EE|nr:ribosomal protein S18-alanine N-acetyltransferase [Virgibacillus siamensis]
MIELVLRDMKLSDTSDVMLVETASYDAPWPEDIFHQEIANNHYAHYYVAVADGKIVGYAGMWLVIDDAQITNIAISPEHRGQKYGQKLFYHMMKQAVLMGAKRMSLEVRESNIPAQRMYRKFGLVPGGIRKNYYTDNQEDAIVMWVNLS